MRERLKFLCLFLLLVMGAGFAYAGGGGGGYQDYGLWHNARVMAISEPTGAGLVYASWTEASVNNCTQSSSVANSGRTNNTNNYPAKFYLYTKPADATLYKFDHWECTKREGDILDYGSKHAAYVGDIKEATSTTVLVGLTKLDPPNTGSKSDNPSNYRDTINAIWVAHYVPIRFFDVTAKSNNNSWGSVEVIGPSGNNAENKVGDQVTLYARTEDYYTMFRGWKLNGEWVRDNQGNIIRDVPYTFTVTEQNKGEYVAQFETGYEFMRIKNHNTGHYISSKTYYSGGASTSVQALMSALSQFELNTDLTSSLDDQGTIARLTNYKRQGTSQYVQEIEIRGFNTNQVYKVSEGVFLQISHCTDNTWDIGKGVSVDFHLLERNGGLVGSQTETGNYKWDFEGVDKDLTTKENYYTPGDLIQNANGLWYTTHRAAWNTKFDTNEITAYIVTGVDANGELALTEVTGGIIPKGVPVLLECQSNDVTRNVMIPTLTNASFTATSGNILKTPEHYYPGEPAPEAAPSGQCYYALGVNSEGNVGFVSQVTNTSTGMNGNRGYYLGPSPAVIPVVYPQITLAELLESGDTETIYEITDLTAVTLVDNDRLVICKDDNDAANSETASDTQIDYMQELSGLQSSDYDRSNWVGLRLPEGKEATNEFNDVKPLVNVVGRLVNETNPTIQLIEMPEVGTASSYTPNVYVPASFKGTQTSPENGKTYFFVQPKPMEVATIDWAQWNGEKFVTVPMTEDESGRVVNEAGLSGGFDFNGLYLTEDVDDMTAGNIYSMLAVVKAKLEGYDQYPEVYVLGEVNGMGWQPNQGVKMMTDDGNLYSVTLTANNVEGNGYGYFSFTTELAENNDEGGWNYIAPYRFGAVGSGDFPVNDNLGVWLNLTKNSYQAFKAPIGKYRLDMNLSEMKLKITRVANSSQAPRREGAAPSDYVVYPLNMTYQGAVNDNVITGVRNVNASRQVKSVTYYDATGRMSSRPFHGMNIVVTRYTDGSTATRKTIQ